MAHNPPSRDTQWIANQLTRQGAYFTGETLAWSINDHSAAGSALGAVHTTWITQAVNTINEVLAVDFEFTVDTEPTSGNYQDHSYGNSNNRITFNGRNASGSGTSGTYAFYPTIADIFLDLSWGSNKAANIAWGSYGLLTIIHEFGHALGLAHPGAYNGSGNYHNDAEYLQDTHRYSVMSYFSANSDGSGANHSYNGSWKYPQTLMVHDIAALTQGSFNGANFNGYGLDPGTRTGNSVYGYNASAGINPVFDFTENIAPVLTIYDAGGNDTLDLSGDNVSQAKLIDLRPGQYSSTHGMTFNIGIADGTLIENAIGTAYADTFYGNGANNRLEGGAGNDVYDLVDSSGHDVIRDTSGADSLRLAASAAGQLSGSRRGNDLVIAIGADGTRSVTVEDWYVPSGHRIETILVDGNPLSAAAFNDLLAQAAGTSRRHYTVTQSGTDGAYLDFGASARGLVTDMVREIIYVGSDTQIDRIFVREGTRVDFTAANTSQDAATVGRDVSFLGGAFADYSIAQDATSDRLIITRTDRGALGERVEVRVNAVTEIWFSDGVATSFDLARTIDPSVSWGDIADTSRSSSDIAAQTAGAGQTLRISTTQMAQDAPVVIAAATSVQMAGKQGVDTVYVEAGGSADATRLGAGQDVIHLTGNWADYAKIVQGLTVRFTRTVGSDTESVLVAASVGAANDLVVFANGAMASNMIRLGLNANGLSWDAVGQTGWDSTRTTLLPNAALPSETVAAPMPAASPPAAEVEQQPVDHVLTLDDILPSRPVGADFALRNADLDGLANLDPRSDLLLYAVGVEVALAAAEAARGLVIRLVNLTEAGRDMSIDLGDLAERGRISVRSDGAGGSVIRIDPRFDLDVGSQYRIEVSEGAFIDAAGTDSVNQALDVMSGPAFTVVTPTMATASPASIYRFDADGAHWTTAQLAEGPDWYDLSGMDGGYAMTLPIDASAGDYAIYLGRVADAGMDAAGYRHFTVESRFHAEVAHFGPGDVLYLDDRANDFHYGSYDEGLEGYGGVWGGTADLTFETGNQLFFNTGEPGTQSSITLTIAGHVESWVTGIYANDNDYFTDTLEELNGGFMSVIIA